MNDVTTFFLAFLATFGGIAALLLHLERVARRLEARVGALEAAQATTANVKRAPSERRSDP